MIRQYLVISDIKNEENELFKYYDLDKDCIVKEITENAFEIVFDDELVTLDISAGLKKFNLSSRVYRLIFTNRKERVN